MNFERLFYPFSLFNCMKLFKRMLLRPLLITTCSTLMWQCYGYYQLEGKCKFTVSLCRYWTFYSHRNHYSTFRYVKGDGNCSTLWMDIFASHMERPRK